MINILNFIQIHIPFISCQVSIILVIKNKKLATTCEIMSFFTVGHRHCWIYYEKNCIKNILWNNVQNKPYTMLKD